MVELCWVQEIEWREKGRLHMIAIKEWRGEKRGREGTIVHTHTHAHREEKGHA